MIKIAALSGLVFLLMVSNAMAVNVTVRVFDGASPLGGATVCLVAEGDPSQFGVRTTPESGSDIGIVTFKDVEGSRIVIAHKDGYVGQTGAFTFGGGEVGLRVDFSLQKGAPLTGPTCQIAVPLGVRIQNFSINEGAATTAQLGVQLRWVTTSTGTADMEYRVSEDPQFTESQWLPAPQRQESSYTYEAAYELTRAAGEKTLYLQMRYASQPDNRSQVAEATIAWVPELTFTFAQTVNLHDVVPFAEEHGWDFGRQLSYQESQPCLAVLVDSEEAGVRGLRVLAQSGFFSSLWFPVTCQYQLFDGRELNEGWTLQSYTINTDSPPNLCTDDAFAQVTSRPESGARSIRLDITVHAGGFVNFCELVVEEITLIGPLGGDWREAFRSE